MNSNNWLSFPLSPTHSSLPPHLHTAQSHNFNLGVVHDNMDTPFPNQGRFTTLFCLCSFSHDVRTIHMARTTN